MGRDHWQMTNDQAAHAFIICWDLFFVVRRMRMRTLSLHYRTYRTYWYSSTSTYVLGSFFRRAAKQGNIAVFVCTSLGPLDMTKASVPYDG